MWLLLLLLLLLLFRSSFQLVEQHLFDMADTGRLLRENRNCLFEAPGALIYCVLNLSVGLEALLLLVLLSSMRWATTALATAKFCTVDAASTAAGGG